MLSSRKIDVKATQSATHKRRSVAAKAGATVTMVVTTVGCNGSHNEEGHT
jgi:hypothetical protein